MSSSTESDDFPDLVDDFSLERCGECGSRVITSDGVCLLCSSSKTSRKRKTQRRPERETFQSERLEKVTMYLGLLLTTMGGPGIVLISYIHDWFRLPLPGPEYDAYAAFGPVNFFVAVIGLVVLTMGIFFLVASLKAGKVIGQKQPDESSH